MRREDIEADGKLFVGRSEQHDVVDTFGRDDAQNSIHQISMRVEYGNTFTVFDVLLDEVKEQRRFAGAGGTDDVSVPHALLGRLHAIERRHRRTRAQGVRNAPRTLDLDLLLFGRRRMRVTNLSIPHPRMHARAFVLRPLVDVAPAVSIPGHGPARLLLRNVAGQRVARTRAHRLPD